jgi:hypothetical protein
MFKHVEQSHVSIPTIIEHRISKEGLGMEEVPQKRLSNIGGIQLILPCMAA